MSEEETQPPFGLGGAVYGTDTSSHQHEYRVANGPQITIRYCVKCGKSWYLDRTHDEIDLVWRDMRG